MATLNGTNPTLLDHAKRTDPNGAIAQIVETMTQKTPALEDMSFIEGNLPTGHVFTHRTGLPSLGWRRYNKGVAKSKSKTDQITEACGALGGMSRVDVRLANLNGNAPAFRASEDVAFVQAFRHEAEEAIFYSSTKSTPDQIHGLSPRLDALSGIGSEQIINAGGIGADNTSIWLVCWSPETVFGMFPKGTKAGLDQKDMGEQLVQDDDGNEYRAYVTDWTWNLGVCVKDSRYIVRIANIDVSDLADTGNALIKLMVKASEEKLQDKSSGRCAWYVNRKIATYLRLQAMDSVKNSTLTIESVGGKPVTMFDGIPVRRTDALLNTEAALT